MPFAIETLSGQPGREAFDCGVDDLNDWLRRFAHQNQSRGLVLVRVALHPDDGRIVGYYATKAYQLEGPELQAAIGGTARYPVPCVLLARLARCETVRGQGVGEALLTHALRAAVRVADNTGVKFVVVHALDEAAASFYRGYGFMPFVDHPHHLLLPVKTARAAFED